jgi:hypothetical protein
MKIAFGMIVFEGDYVLRECIEQVYPFASQILIAEGPVKYWQNLGKKTSEDYTNNIIDNFPDPDNKIKIVHSQYSEKDEQCNAYINLIDDDIDYLWNLDSDELFKTDDIKKIIDFLEKEKPSSVSIRSCTFYGGFDHYLTGFEQNADNFRRIFRITKGCKWLTHRPPTIDYPIWSNISIKHINGDELYYSTGVQMYHYSYVFPDQVFKKITYYKEVLSGDNSIDNYFENVYLPWINGDDSIKMYIENIYDGVHEFKPQYRGSCRTKKFNDSHPESILNNLDILKSKFVEQKIKYV